MIEPSRRGLLLGLGAIIAAPAIVRASSLMPIKALRSPVLVCEVGEWRGVRFVLPTYTDPAHTWDGPVQPIEGEHYLKYLDELGEIMREAIQPLTKLRQFTEGP